MEKTLAGTAWCRDCQIHYYLLTDRMDHGLESYGVSVEYLGETAVCAGIAPRCRQIMELLELLRRGAVTPVALGDVVEKTGWYPAPDGSRQEQGREHHSSDAPVPVHSGASSPEQTDLPDTGGEDSVGFLNWSDPHKGGYGQSLTTQN